MFKKKPSKRDIENNSIEKSIKDMYKASKGRYGAHKIHASLEAIGVTISIKRIQRLIKNRGKICSYKVLENVVRL
jgi:hypothetical protein